MQESVSDSPPEARCTNMPVGETFQWDYGNEAALMSSFLGRVCIQHRVCACLFLLLLGPGEFRRSSAELEGHRDRHGGDPGCDVSGHPVRHPAHAG